MKDCEVPPLVPVLSGWGWQGKFKKIFISFLAVIFFCLNPSPGHSALTGTGQDISFKAGVDRTTLGLGSSLELTLTLIGGTRAIAAPELPDMDGFESRYLGPLISTSIINGKYSQTIVFRYILYPLKAGHFQIPAMSIVMDRETYATRSIDIKVVDTSAHSPAKGGAQAGTQTSRTAALKDRIFITMTTPKSQVYLNEKIPLTIRLLINGVDVKNIQYPEFGHTGFSVDDYQKPVEYQQVLRGIRYHVWEFKTHIYPTREGELTLGPAKQTCSILFKKPRRRKRRASFFDDDFFGGFFDTYDTLAVTLESSDLMIHVLPFPGKRKPRDFSGAVGQFDFAVSVNPVVVKVGDPITVRMRVSGEGNLMAVVMPSFPVGGGDQKSFKFYQPQISEEAGAKILEQVVIPVTDNVKELPEIRFSYLDTREGRYQTLTKGPFALKVTAVAEGEELKIVGLEETGKPGFAQEEQVGRGIVFIKGYPGRFYTVGSRLYRDFFFLLIGTLFILVWVIFWVVYRVTHRIRTDVKFARRLRAPGHAREGLLAARDYMDKGEERKFYDTLFRTLQNYFGNKFHMASGTITVETIKEVVLTKRMKAAVPEDIKAVFDECEMVRYASARCDKEKMKASYRRAEKIIDFFERNWR